VFSREGAALTPGVGLLSMSHRNQGGPQHAMGVRDACPLGRAHQQPRACHSAPPPRGTLALRAHLPAVSREPVGCSPDHEAVSTGVIPAVPHHAITKRARHTPPHARCHHPLRPRVSRLVRDALVLAHTLTNPRGAITSFLGHDPRKSAAA